MLAARTQGWVDSHSQVGRGQIFLVGVAPALNRSAIPAGRYGGEISGLGQDGQDELSNVHEACVYSVLRTLSQEIMVWRHFLVFRLLLR
jgi:hypothetical protein